MNCLIYGNEKYLLIASTVVFILLDNFVLAKPHSNHSLMSQISKRQQNSFPLLPVESRQRPPSPEQSSWSSPPNVQWIDHPPVASNNHLLPVLYLMAPLVVTALLIPIGATLIAAAVMMKINNPSNAPGTFKAALFPRDEEVAPIFRILEQNLLDLWQKLEDAILKYDSNL